MSDSDLSTTNASATNEESGQNSPRILFPGQFRLFDPMVDVPENQICFDGFDEHLCGGGYN